MPEGMRPAINVSAMLMTTSATPPATGKMAFRLSIPVRWCTTRLMGMMSNSVMPMPMAPEQKPSMSVYALNTREMSRLLAPMARRMPISFVRSRTEIYVMMPIIMLDTTSEIATNAIST